MMRRALPLLLALGLMVLLAVGLNRDPQLVPSPFIGKPAPEFELPRLLNQIDTVSTAKLKGEYFLFNVWGSWCPACRDEHDFLLELSANRTIPIIGLNWKDTKENALGWLQVLGNPYREIAFDPVGDVAIDWGIYGAPETFLVDADGVVRHKHIGPLDRGIWERDFVPLLNSGQR